MFEALKKVRAWISIDSANDLRAFGPRISPEVQEALYVLSTCMTCGCCSESCPQVNEKSPFMGPAAMSQVRLFNSNPIGKLEKSERLRAVMDEGGHSRLRQRPKLRQSLSEKYPPDRIARLDWPGSI